jgi:hypothetical protein
MLVVLIAVPLTSGTAAAGGRLASNYANPSYAMPDIIYDALWNGAANTQPRR